MEITQSGIPDVLIIEPKVFEDERGWFCESFNKAKFKKYGISADFVQDNHSRSGRNVLRGLHYQINQPQGKLVRVVNGEVFDVAVDIRRSSPTFGRWVGLSLSAENRKMLWIPPGFAHGFLALTDEVDFLYKTTDYYAPQFERTIVWNDSELAIQWPLKGKPIVSAKDQAGQLLAEAPHFA
jgi:dTDP-4-dehydrorhamnose 3,5-epimerase